MTGDTADILTRLKALLPNGWFKGSTPVLDGILTGIASGLSQVYGFIAYARLQTRIATATDAFLDLISFDYFGYRLPRRSSESDTAFRTRLKAALLLERATRKGMVQALTLLTGRAPILFEPANPLDTKCYNSTAFYNKSGSYGSVALPFQVFIIAYRPFVQSAGNLSTYNGNAYYNSPTTNYANLGLRAAAVTDQDIYNTIDSVKPANTIVWVQLQN